MTRSLTALVTLQRVPSGTVHDTAHCKNLHGSPVKYKYSTTSDRIHESWAPVSTKAGALRTLSSSMNHSGESEGTPVILCRLVKHLTRGLRDRRAPARFPAARSSGGYSSDSVRLAATPTLCSNGPWSSLSPPGRTGHIPGLPCTPLCCSASSSTRCLSSDIDLFLNEAYHSI